MISRNRIGLPSDCQPIGPRSGSAPSPRATSTPLRTQVTCRPGRSPRPGSTGRPAGSPPSGPSGSHRPRNRARPWRRSSRGRPGRAGPGRRSGQTLCGRGEVEQQPAVAPEVGVGLQALGPVVLPFEGQDVIAVVLPRWRSSRAAGRSAGPRRRRSRSSRARGRPARTGPGRSPGRAASDRRRAGGVARAIASDQDRRPGRPSSVRAPWIGSGDRSLTGAAAGRLAIRSWLRRWSRRDPAGSMRWMGLGAPLVPDRGRPLRWIDETRDAAPPDSPRDFDPGPDVLRERAHGRARRTCVAPSRRLPALSPASGRPTPRPSRARRARRSSPEEGQKRARARARARAKPRKKKKAEAIDDGTGATKLEETPVLDTYEARQRARWIIGGVLGGSG